jgi:homoserine kinase
LIGGKLSQYELFQIASRLEKHPDNVGASLFGGIVVAFWDGARAEAIRLEPDPRLEALVAIPSFELATEKARHALPAQVSMRDAVFNLSHASLLVAAFAAGDFAMIRHAMQDALHQPYRTALVPGMETILREAVNHGALGAALSGAGPTMLALVDAGSPQRAGLERFLRETFRAAGVEAETLWLKPAKRGVEVDALGPDAGGLDQLVASKGEVRA